MTAPTPVGPQDLPVEQPSLFELAIDAGTAGQLGLDVPKSILGRASEVRGRR